MWLHTRVAIGLGTRLVVGRLAGGQEPGLVVVVGQVGDVGDLVNVGEASEAGGWEGRKLGTLLDASFGGQVRRQVGS